MLADLTKSSVLRQAAAGNVAGWPERLGSAGTRGGGLDLSSGEERRDVRTQVDFQFPVRKPTTIQSLSLVSVRLEFP